jgi:hypothetical protein
MPEDALIAREQIAVFCLRRRGANGGDRSCPQGSKFSALSHHRSLRVEKFTTQGDDWDLQYAYDCSSFGMQGNFMVAIKGGDGSMTGMMVNKLGRSEADTDHYHTGGTFFLEVNSECSWHIKVMG